MATSFLTLGPSLLAELKKTKEAKLTPIQFRIKKLNDYKGPRSYKKMTRKIRKEFGRVY